MMNVRTMSLIADVASAGVTPPAATEAARRWGCREGTARWHRSSANHVFAVELHGRRRWLRLAHSSERQQSEIEAELDFIAHASEAGVAVAEPLRSLAGELVEEVRVGNDRYHAVLFEGLTGQCFDDPTELTQTMCREWGRTAARLHATAERIAPPDGRCRSWEAEFRQAAQTLPQGEEAAKRQLASACAWMTGLPSGDGTFGLIHGDLELDNLVWDGGAFQVLDFDSAGYHWYAADIAKATADLMDCDAGAVAYGQFVAGYREVREIAWQEEALPRFRRADLALTFARLLHSWADADPAEDLPWRASMRQRHMSVLSRLRLALEQPFEW